MIEKNIIFVAIVFTKVITSYLLHVQHYNYYFFIEYVNEILFYFQPVCIISYKLFPREILYVY